MSGIKLLRTRYLIDSVILIDHFNGVKKATKWQAKNRESNSVFSVITRGEILCGIGAEDKFLITSLLER